MINVRKLKIEMTRQICQFYIFIVATMLSIKQFEEFSECCYQSASMWQKSFALFEQGIRPEALRVILSRYVEKSDTIATAFFVGIMRLWRFHETWKISDRLIQSVYE
jgi:hypothetical protein